jgi:hypothetical protein
MVIAALIGAAQTLAGLLAWFCLDSNRWLRAGLLLGLAAALAAF